MWEREDSGAIQGNNTMDRAELRVGYLEVVSGDRGKVEWIF